MKKYIIYLCFCIIGFVLPAFSQPSITISPTTVVYGDAITVTFSDTEPIESLPDLNAFQRDFVIRQRQQFQQTSIVNGTKKSEYHFQLVVFPRKSGVFEMGPFQWKNKYIPAQSITVKEEPVGVKMPGNMPQNADALTQQQNSNAVFKVETSVENSSVYIGETTLYKIRLYNNIGLTQPQMELPFSDDYTLSPYGQEQLTQTTMDGQRVWLYERSFLLTPKKTGTLVIPEVSVAGVIPDTSAPRHRVFGGQMFQDMFANDPFFNMTVGFPEKEVYKQSNPVQLTVKEKPVDWEGWWLPAKEVSLTEDYKTTTVAQVGKPIERRIQLQASGVEGHQLPLLTQASDDTFKVYANPEKRSQIAMNGTIVGYEEITFVIVPMKSGEMIVPSIRVDWFNTSTAQKETTILPSRTFVVESAEEVTESNGTSALNGDEPDLSKKSNQSADLSLKEQSLAVSDKQEDINAKQVGTNNVFWLLVLGVLSVVLATVLGLLGYWLGRRKQVKTLTQSVKTDCKKKQKKKPLPDLYPF